MEVIIGVQQQTPEGELGVDPCKNDQYDHADTEYQKVSAVMLFVPARYGRNPVPDQKKTCDHQGNVRVDQQKGTERGQYRSVSIYDR